MTKSEATVISDMAIRALRALGVNMPWGMMTHEVKNKVEACLREGVDELQRIRDMALAELKK